MVVSTRTKRKHLSADGLTVAGGVNMDRNEAQVASPPESVQKSWFYCAHRINLKNP